MPSRKPQPKESEILKSILEYLTLRGVFHWRQNVISQALYSNGKRRYVKAAFPGVSDILGILPDGRALAIEVKRPGERPTLDQQAFLLAVNANKAVGFVATSVDDVRKAGL